MKGSSNSKSGLEIEMSQQDDPSSIKDLDFLQEMTPSSIAQDYFESTTTHGLGRIFSAKNNYVRMFWLLIFLLVFCYFIRSVYELAVKASKNDIVTNVHTRFYNSMDFPAVTFCNANPFRKSKIGKFSKGILQNGTNSLRQNISVEEILRSLELSKLNDTELYQVGHQEEIFLMKGMKTCYFGYGECNFTSDFASYSSPLVGNCFTFESKNHVQRRASSEAGLFAALNINQDEYMVRYRQFKPAGAKVMIHHRHEAFPETQSILLAPGTLTDIKIEKRLLKRLPAPFPDECTKAETMGIELGLPLRYSIEFCQMTCYLKQQNESCGCVSPLFESQFKSLSAYLSRKVNPEIFRFKIAKNRTQLTCISKFDLIYSKGTVPCDCRPPCEEEEFSFTISSSAWPPLNDAGNLLSDIKHVYMKEKQFINWTVDKLYQNVLAVKVYFKDFTVESVEQRTAYNWDDFLSDLGGQMGLWIGASVFSGLEFGAFIAKLITYCLFWRKKKTSFPITRKVTHEK